MNRASFWIVVTMIREFGFCSCRLSSAVDLGAVDRVLLEAVVLPHRLVVEVLAVDDEQHLVDARQLATRAERS